ncbi:TPA: hypothetical protein L5621_006617 [Pseudomonas aeruginosa]|nr:hypothetical protein [Pseudomonas aeruginosa]
MSMKKVQIGVRPSNKADSVAADAWVESRSNGDSPERMKRLTIDVAESLHRQIKTACAQRGTKIADEVRELLLQKYGNQ